MEEVKDDNSKKELASQLKAAANALYDDYVNDKELAAFIALDCEDFLTENEDDDKEDITSSTASPHS